MKFILEAIKKPSGCVLCSLPAETNDGIQNLILHRLSHCYIVMNKYPYNSGHLMVVPFAHTASFSDLDERVLLDLQKGIGKSIDVLQRELRPHGFNIGMNLGEAGGAGIRDHMHYHIVPRWNGDTNFMPAVGDTKVLPESIEDTFSRLFGHF